MASPDPTVSEPEVYDDVLTEETSISDEDRREILADIEDVVRKNRITVSEDLFRIRPQKSGVLLPTLINILAIAAVGAVFYYSARFFEARQETMSLQVSTVTGAEGRLLEELKRESAEQIARKEEEISRIQDELARIESQARTLQTDFESALQQREEELRAELELELEAERVRLQALDITPAEMDSRLREFEIQKQQELQQRIEEFRIQMQAGDGGTGGGAAAGPGPRQTRFSTKPTQRGRQSFRKPLSVRPGLPNDTRRSVRPWWRPHLRRSCASRRLPGVRRRRTC